MNPILVGECNPYSDDPRHALLPWPPNASGDRLCRILGLDHDEYLLLFDRANLVEGRHWSAREARDAAIRMEQDCVGRVLILLGKKVQEAFGHKNEAFVSISPLVFLDGQRLGTITLVCLPHPSGLNRVWHEPGNFVRARRAVYPHLPSKLCKCGYYPCRPERHAGWSPDA